MGCEVSDHQVKLLALAKEVIILFDGDEAGTKGALGLREKLAGQRLVRIIHLPEGSEPETLPARTLRWLVNGVQQLDLIEVRFRTAEKPEPPTPTT